MAALLVVVVAGGWLWMSNRASAAPIVPPSPVQESPVVTEPAPTVESPNSTPPAEVAPPASRIAPRDPPAATVAHSPVTYVGTLSIDADPAGDVFIDRRTAGRTPLRLTNLKAGSHLVWIERDGYQRWTRVVQVPSDRVSRLWADLEPLPSR
jgi:hypothetical protein